MLLGQLLLEVHLKLGTFKPPSGVPTSVTGFPPPPHQPRTWKVGSHLQQFSFLTTLFLPWKLLTHQPSPVVFMSLPPFRCPRAGILCLSLNWSVCLQSCPSQSLLYAATGGIFLRHRLDHATILSDSSLDPHVPQDDSIKISYNVDPNKLHSHIPTKSITAATPRLSVLFLALGLRALRGEPRDR